MTSAQSSNSIGTPRRTYEVFLSFRGEDVRDNFLAHLYGALHRKGILTFKDDDKLRVGEYINDGLLKAIQESSISVVVLSKSYANSTWCLKELVHILERTRSKVHNHVIYPIFYHVTPSEVRKQEGAFGDEFAKLLGNIESGQWREALLEVGGLKGWAYPSVLYENEANLIDDVVHTTFIELINTYRYHAEDLVGIRPRMAEVIELLDLGSEKPRVVGLWGMGGIGKTTLATAVYEAISWKFDASSLIENVSQTSEVLAVQKKLILDILMEKEIDKLNSVSAMEMIRNRVCRIRVLIVLDDVDGSKGLGKLVGKLHWFSHGSRLIITTRDKHVLTAYGVQEVDIFNVKELNNVEAIQLFTSTAFTENGDTEDFKMLIDRAIQYAKGVPLALEVLGSSLVNETYSHWESVLDSLRESHQDELQQILRISYDGLSKKEKEIFLDICCFFKNMDRGLVIKILDSCGFYAVAGINHLVKKSVLSLSVDDKLQMHDLIQKMGWSIVDEESWKEPGKRSRLWRASDVKDVIMQNTGTMNVEGILVWPENIQPRPDAFANMLKLRLLWIHGAWCSIDLSYKLRLLSWDGCPLKCMPLTFQPDHLVTLSLTNSCIEQLWDGKMALPKLIALNLNNSTSLTKCPDFEGFPSLESLDLEGCTAILDLHPSITKLKNLISLRLKDCKSLQNLPDSFESQCLNLLEFSGCLKLRFTLESFQHLERLSRLDLNQTDIIDLHHSIGYCTDLCYLDLSDCKQLRSIPRSIEKLKKLKQLILVGSLSLSMLPEEVGFIDSLELLDISFSGVTQLPDSVACLRNLRRLECQGYKGKLPSFSEFKSLEYLNLSFCSLTSFPESISCCTSLKELYLSENDFEWIPTSIKQFCNLEILRVNECKRLQKLPELPSSILELDASGCESLGSIGSKNAYQDASILLFSAKKLVRYEEISIMRYQFILDQLKENKHPAVRGYRVPGSTIPKWIANRDVRGLVKLHFPILDLKASNLLGFTFSAVVASKGQRCRLRVHIGNGKKIIYTGSAINFMPDSEGVIILFYPAVYFSVDELNDMGGNVLEVCFVTEEDDGKVRFYEGDKALEPAPQVKECGVHLIYEVETGIPQSSLENPSFGTSVCRDSVFFSFRGEDVHSNFLEYLYCALRERGISALIDDDELRDGENIKDGLLEAIEESSFSIVVLSINYANSSWCLKELVHILECKRTKGHVVYPIFYHVTPSEVRKQEGAFGEGFAQVLDGDNIESGQWREALEEVGNLEGWTYPSSRFEWDGLLLTKNPEKSLESVAGCGVLMISKT